MPGGDADPTAERVTVALAEAIPAGEVGDTTVGMPGDWLLVATYTDGDGGERTVFLTPDDQSLHVTLGLLHAGREVWGEAMRRWVLGTGDGE